MTQTEKIVLPPPFPDHTQLPESDGTFVENFQEHPQSIILTESISPMLEKLHPDGQYIIGQDCGIYWQETEPPEKGAKAPDWFYVPIMGRVLLQSTDVVVALVGRAWEALVGPMTRKPS